MSVSVKKGVEERYKCESVGGIGKQCEFSEELVLGRELQVISWLSLSIVHGILLHAHERRVRVGLGHGVALSNLLKPAVILTEFVAVLLQFPYLPLMLAELLLPLLVRGLGFCRECVFQTVNKRVRCFRSELHRLCLRCLLLSDGIVNLPQKHSYIFLKLSPVFLNGLPPYKGVFVGL